ncbi:MAG: ATP-binding protein, partial [Akkermansia sp.]
EYKRIKRKDEDDSFEDEPGGRFKKDDEVHFEVINTYHTDIEGEEVKFNLREESEGTQILFGVLALILMVLEEGNTLIIDELDSSLHPLIVRELVRLFKDKTYNEKNAQLIFTTHTTDLLDDDLMRVSEVAIVNKTLKKGTTARRLSQFEGIRNVTNFRKRYMEGAFKGIPYPYI